MKTNKAFEYYQLAKLALYKGNTKLAQKFLVKAERCLARRSK